MKYCIWCSFACVLHMGLSAVLVQYIWVCWVWKMCSVQETCTHQAPQNAQSCETTIATTKKGRQTLNSDWCGRLNPWSDRTKGNGKSGAEWNCVGEREEANKKTFIIVFLWLQSVSVPHQHCSAEIILWATSFLNSPLCCLCFKLAFRKCLQLLLLLWLIKRNGWAT